MVGRMGSREALGFGEAAALYDRVRPGYPSAVFDAVLAAVPAPARALEAGAGTGLATVELARRGLIVDAVEPDARMAKFARGRCEQLTVRVRTGMALARPRWCLRGGRDRSAAVWGPRGVVDPPARGPRPRLGSRSRRVSAVRAFAGLPDEPAGHETQRRCSGSGRAIQRVEDGIVPMVAGVRRADLRRTAGNATRPHAPAR